MSLGEAKFAYLIRMFPQTSETFIANEILRVERAGLALRVYSYRRPVEKVEHEVVRRIATPISYLPDPMWRSPGEFLSRGRAMRALEPALFRRTLAYVARVSLRDRSVDVWKRFLQALYLAWELRSENVTHLHSHFAHQATQVAMLTSMLSGVPFSFTGHAKDVYTARRRDLAEKIHHASFALTCTGSNRDYLRSLAGAADAAKVDLSYHGVDTGKFAPAGGDRVQDPPLVLAVGRLIEKKGFTDLIEALRLLRQRGVEFRAMMIGNGPDRKKLERARSAAGLDGLLLLPGSRSQESLLELYREASLFVLPSVITRNGDRDGIPNVLMEAMAAGLPVISTRISGIPELVKDGENGVLVEPGDVRSLSKSIEELLRDGRTRSRLAEAGRKSVLEQFDADSLAERLAERFRLAAEQGLAKVKPGREEVAT